MSGRVFRPCGFSAKGKRERLRTRIEKLNLKRPVLNGILLADELIQTVLRNFPVPLRIGVGPVIHSRRLTVNPDAKAHWFAIRGRPEHQMQIPRMEPEHNPTGRGIEDRDVRSIRPAPEESPLIEFRIFRGGVNAGDVLAETASRNKVLGAVTQPT